MPLDRLKIVSEIVATWVGLIALLTGAGFSLIQYLEKERGDRVKATLEFLDRHNKDPVMQARRSLNSVWLRRDAALNDAVSPKNFSVERFTSFVRRVVDEDGLYEPVIVMIDFYDGLDVCMSHKICDQKVTVDLFRQDAKSFWFLHRPFIHDLRVRRNDPSIARHLEALATLPD